MADTKRILEHLAELYAIPTAAKTAEEVAALNLEKLNKNYDKYDEAFKPYMTVDVMKSIDEYWKFKNDKIRPTLAQILAGLNASGVEKEKPEEVIVAGYDIRELDPAYDYYMRDVETKDGKDVHALLFYRWALKDIISEYVDTLPNGHKMSGGEKMALIRRNGWDSDIGERVERYARGQGKAEGSVNEFVSSLAKSWSVGNVYND